MRPCLFNLVECQNRAYLQKGLPTAARFVQFMSESHALQTETPDRIEPGLEILEFGRLEPKEITMGSAISRDLAPARV